MDLAQKKCVPCEGGREAFSAEDVHVYLLDTPLWQAVDDKKITREFKFKDFIAAINFVNAIADIAEEEGHHPDLHIFYNRVIVELTTHAVKGLTENDFIMAAKINQRF